MTLQLSITDFAPLNKDGKKILGNDLRCGVRPIIKAEITSENSPSIFSYGEGKASEQCARYEALAVKIKELVETFYREEVAEIE